MDYKTGNISETVIEEEIERSYTIDDLVVHALSIADLPQK